MFLKEIAIIQERITQQPLIGSKAHAAVETTLVGGFKPKYKTQTALAQPSAVLILLYPEQEKVHFSLILRPEYTGKHSGEVALPGGKYDPHQDAHLIDTALRETEEELGICSQQIQVIQTLSDYHVFVSNYVITPVVGFVKEKPAFQPESREVAALIPVSLKDFLALPIEITHVQAGTTTLRVPYFPVNEHKVWGATAAILNELRILLLGS